MYQRRQSSETHVGPIGIGGANPIRIQSMGTVDTNNTEGCVAQAKRIIDAGGELVRFTTQGIREAENMKNISARLKADGYNTPLVAMSTLRPIPQMWLLSIARRCASIRVTMWILVVRSSIWNIPTRSMLPS